MSKEKYHKENSGNASQADVDQTQSGKPKRRSERYVVALMFCLFFGMEVCFRLGENFLSNDIIHLKSFPAISKTVAQFPPDQGVRILFLGNSLTRYGVDQQVFSEEMNQQFDLSVQTIKMNPDNTDIADWFYAYRTFFFNRGVHPDVVIISFGETHLQDGPSSHPDRLARYYCTWSDFPELCQSDLKTFEERVGFLLCKVSSAYGNRERIQKRVLDLLIPDYRLGMERLNERRNHYATGSKKTPGYHRLTELISLAHSQGTQIILAAMPAATAYDLDAGLLELIETSPAILADCRTVQGLGDSMFFDTLHMNQQAARLYSRSLAQKTEPALKPILDLPVLTNNMSPDLSR